jgi:two-component system chemotaxis sensor kinase CheA
MSTGAAGDRESGVLREFLAEAEDLVETLQSGLADLRDAIARSELPIARVNELFRAAHSLKSLAALFEVPAARDLAHRLEEMLDAPRMNRVSDAASAVECLADGAAIFAQALPRLGDPEALQGLADATRALEQRFAAISARESAGAAGLPAPDSILDPVLARALTEFEEHRLRECTARGQCIALADAVFDLLSFEEKLRALSDALRGCCEILATLPSPTETASGGIRFQLLVASDAAPDVLRELARSAGAELRVLRASGASQRIAVPGSGLRSAAPAEVPTAIQSSLRSLSDTLRVDFRKLDALMNLAGELATLAPSSAAIGTRLAVTPSAAELGADFERLRRSFERWPRRSRSSLRA